MSLKAVLDTKVIVSGIFWRGASFEILKARQEGGFRLILSRPIFERVSHRRVVEGMTHKQKISTVDAILELLEQNSQTVEAISFAGQVCSDADDDKFLAAACAARAQCVVSGDAALLKSRTVRGFKSSNRRNF